MNINVLDRYSGDCFRLKCGRLILNLSKENSEFQKKKKMFLYVEACNSSPDQRNT